jgi:hypothetical protein
MAALFLFTPARTNSVRYFAASAPAFAFNAAPASAV